MHADRRRLELTEHREGRDALRHALGDGVELGAEARVVPVGQRSSAVAVHAERGAGWPWHQAARVWSFGGRRGGAVGGQ